MSALPSGTLKCMSILGSFFLNKKSISTPFFSYNNAVTAYELKKSSNSDRAL